MVIAPGAEHCRMLETRVRRRFDEDMIVMDNGIVGAGRAEHAMWLAWRLSRRLLPPAVALHPGKSNILKPCKLCILGLFEASFRSNSAGDTVSFQIALHGSHDALTDSCWQLFERERGSSSEFARAALCWSACASSSTVHPYTLASLMLVAAARSSQGRAVSVQRIALTFGLHLFQRFQPFSLTFLRALT